MDNTYIRGSWLNLADLSGVSLHKAVLDGSSMIGANLSGVNLSDAKLRGVELVGCKLNGADLRGTDFRGSNLSRKPEPFDLRSGVHDPALTELRPAVLATLNAHCDLRGAVYDDRTQWPFKFVVPPGVIFVK